VGFFYVKKGCNASSLFFFLDYSHHFPRRNMDTPARDRRGGNDAELRTAKFPHFSLPINNLYKSAAAIYAAINRVKT